MREYQRIVADHILSGFSATGVLTDLTPEYKKQKASKGYAVYPIGVASGKLLQAIQNGQIIITKK
jgi:hypothetical protein